MYVHVLAGSVVLEVSIAMAISHLLDLEGSSSL